MVQLAQLSTWIEDQSHFLVQYIWNLMTLKLAIPWKIECFVVSWKNVYQLLPEQRGFLWRKENVPSLLKENYFVNTWPCSYCPWVSRKCPGLYTKWFKSIHWQENCNREELSTTYISGSILYLTFPCQKPW